MGEDEGYAMPGEPLLNGLLPGASLVMRSLNKDRWIKAEEQVAELIACIQPNQFSEERRNAVADYVQKLIMKCIPCEVCTFGSVPLKTYLPDGDIDLTTFSHNQNSIDTWANQVRDMLESEEKNENAKFHVKEVQYIQAEVRIIKCLVGNIVVDISFNQIGGLCTLCFLDEVDSLINQNHLFKRSIILIKAWCYYESRILGAHHGLISTYALETLVLYIFHVFNNSFNGPLEVLYRFLVFFSNFDWDNFCVSLWGPVPISSLPDVTAKPPRKDSGELLLSKVFLEACSSVYAVFPGGQENNGQPFAPKNFNVIDPLRVNNNLGRSVSKGNFFRIRSAFAFGAKRLAELLDCPKDKLIYQVDQFFMNTWDRHRSSHRPDAPGIDSWPLRLSAPDRSREFGSSNNNDNNANTNNSENTNNSTSSKKEKEGSHAHSNAKNLSGKVPLTSGFRNQPRATYQIERGNTNPDQLIFGGKIQKDLANDTQGRLLFARTHSSPELTDISSQVQRNRRTENAETSQKIVGFESLPSHSTQDAFVRPKHGPNQKSPDTSADSSSIVSNREKPSAFSGAQQMMNQEEKDIVNMMGSVSLQSFNGQHHAPFNLTSDHLPYSIPPAFLESMGYTQRNFPGFVPANIPFMDPSFSQVQFQHGLVSSQLTHYFPGIGLNNDPSEDSVEMNSVEADSDFWKEQDVGPSGGHDLDNGNLDTFDNKPSAPPSMRGLKYIPPPFRICQSTTGARVQQKHTREKRGAVRENFKNHIGDVYAEEKVVSSRLSSASHSNSLTSSESSWDESTDKRGKKVISTDDLQGINRKQHHNVPEFEVAQTSGSDSMIPFAPILINPGSRQRVNDNSGMIAFYPTGPPIPFLTMLPMYNIPPENGTCDASSSGCFGGDETTLDNSDSQMSFNPKGHDLSSTSGFLRSTSASDILNSDFASHWQNLQFGRFCQNSNQQGSLLYPSAAMVPPVYVQGQIPIPYNNPSRPVSINTDHFSQPVPSYGHRVAPAKPVTTRHPNIYHSYIDDVPKFRGGTGTYLPNPKVHYNQSSGRGNYNQDRNNSFGERENANPKSRGVSRRRNSTQNVSHEIPNGVSNGTFGSQASEDHRLHRSSEQARHQRRAW